MESPERIQDLLRWSRQPEDTHQSLAKMVKGRGQGSLWIELAPEHARQLGIAVDERFLEKVARQCEVAANTKGNVGRIPLSTLKI